MVIRKYKVSEAKICPSLTLVKMKQKVKVILWKVFILRKRHIILTLLEIFVPIFLFWLVVHFKNLLPEKMEIVSDPSPKLYTNITRIGNYKIAFTPSNNFTETIMKLASADMGTAGCNVLLESKSDEEEVVRWLKKEFIKDIRNKTQNYDFWVTSPKGIGVIFLDKGSENSLTYTLRTTRSDLDTDEDTLFGERNGYGISKYEFSGFLTVQAAIDRSYLTVNQNISIPKITQIVNLPYVEYQVVNLVQLLMPTVVSLGFTFVMPSLLKEVVEERTSGIKELMKIMGLRPWLNWLSWLVYSLSAYVPITVVISVFLTTDSGTGSPVHANFFCVWGMFLLFTFTFLTLLLTISTFFTNGTIAMIAGELVWYGVTIFLDTFIVKSPDKYGIYINLLSCLWPSIALIWSFNTIFNFHRSGKTWTPSNLFDDGAGGGRISVGLAMVMLVVDIGIFSLITWYMDNVKPGPYGRAKPLTFIFKYCRKEQTSETGVIPHVSQHNYEIPPKGANVGIQIDNLSKTYSNGTIVAVKNVNLEIYKGNITALLGHNGAGKTTLMSMLAGLFSPTSGRVVVKDKNIFDHMDQFRSSLGLCPQHNLLFSYFTPLEHLIFFGMLKGMTMRKAKKRGEKILKALEMYERRNYQIAKLSGGMKRKVSLAVALIGKPEVLLLDEPTSGMDPESRRYVWDILLKLRGKRTTILTTHFMEEADVLGDRIAIMNQGAVSCYGTPMYLKKLYGKGYQLHVSKKDAAPVDPIAQVLLSHTTSAQLQFASPTLLSFAIKAEESPKFPKMFSELDSKSSSLGLTTININSTTIEDVFLSVVGGDSEEGKSVCPGVETLDSRITKLRGCRLMLHQIIALVYKRILTMIRGWLSTFIFIAVPAAMMAVTILLIMRRPDTLAPNRLQISLSSFPRVSVSVASDSQTISSKIQKIVTSNRAKYVAIPRTTDLENYMIEQLGINLVLYEREMIAGLEIKGDALLGGYSHYFDHSYALVLNLMANTLIQLNNVSASITVYCHPIDMADTEDICDLAMKAPGHVTDFPQKIIFLSLGLLAMTMGLISFPLRERVSNLKQLQLMSGVSPLQYWLVIFLCDFTFSLVTTALMTCIILVCENSNIFTFSGHISIVPLILVLFGCSGILFAYFFSFFVKSAVKATVSFVVFNIAVGIFGACLLVILERNYTYFGFWRFILSFNPLFSATSALIYLFTAIYLNGTCLQCGNNCNKTDPFNFFEPGPHSENPLGINSFLIFLVVDSFIYLGLVLLLEYGIVKKAQFLISTLWIRHSEGSFEDDADVKSEKDNVLSNHTLGPKDLDSATSSASGVGHSGATSKNNPIFATKFKQEQEEEGVINNTSILQVYNLGKKYNRKTTAVHDVTFQVGQGECFGLLGVNGAGKTTTFKMLTGEVIPDKGDANIKQLSLRKNRRRFLSLIGYCPQFDPISPLLTGKELLRVFALLRGVSIVKCNSEVSKWIKIMGLQEYANRPCGTYSGGNKRKLSTAMAFIGAPPVVFLDEPTSAVDPVSRRRLWDIVAGCQRTGQSIVLTSHSMEECEALCSRLTIMVGGRMKCIGSPQYLKHKFGQGYTIKVKMNSSIDRKNSLNYLKDSVRSMFKHCILKDEHLGLLHYHLPDNSVQLARVFKKMEKLKKRHMLIEDYVVSHTTLEEVFMSFARQNVKGCD